MTTATTIDNDNIVTNSSSVLVDTSFDDWSKIDFVEVVRDRMAKGVNKQTFDEDIRMWQNAIDNLPEYHEKSFLKEVQEMDFSIPRYSKDFSEMQGVYSRLVSYRARVSEMMFRANAHYEVFFKAYKTIKTSAIALHTGTAKDKEAGAEFVAQPYYAGTVNTKRMLDYLIEVLETIDFAATNMNRILREKEAEARVNLSHLNEGSQYNFEKQIQDEGNNWNSGDIRTRKKIKDCAEEDD